MSVTENMQKKAKPCTLSIFNLGSSPVSALPSFFPSKGKKDAQLLKPLGRRHTLALQSNAEGSQGLQNTQNPTELSAIPGYQLFSCGFSPSLTGFSPQHASIHSHSPGRKGIWLEVSQGSTWRSNQMAFTALLSCPEY